MKPLLSSIRQLFCKHDLVSLYAYDPYTQKLHCFKCGSRMVVNSKHKSSINLDEDSEKAYDQLQSDLQLFMTDFRNSMR